MVSPDTELNIGVDILKWLPQKQIKLLILEC